MDGQAEADYTELYDGLHARSWTSTGGGVVTIICLKDLDPETSKGTVIVKLDGVKMGLPPPQDGITWKGSFTASGVFKYRSR